MKYEIKKMFKRSTSLVLALVMVLSGVLAHVGTIALAAPAGYQQADEVLFESDYENAAVWNFDPPESSQPWLWGNVFAKGGEVCAMADPADAENTIMHYAPYRLGFGKILLGNDYKNHDDMKTLSVKKGVTYKVEYRWKANGTPGSNLTMGIGLSNGDAIANDSGAINGLGEDNYLASLNQRSSAADEIVLTAGTACTNEWKSEVTYFTVDEDTDLTNGDQLVMYFAKGSANKVHVYVDDVKVTALAGVTVNYIVGDDTKTVFYGDGNIPEALPEGILTTDTEGGRLNLYKDDKFETPFSAKNYVRTGTYAEVNIYGQYEKAYQKDEVLFESDYENATVWSLEAENGTQPWLWGNVFAKGGEVCAIADPADANNKVIHYAPYRLGFGKILLGNDYKNHDDMKTLSVKKGVTYKVEYRWKANGTPGSNLTMGIGLSNGDAIANDSGAINGLGEDTYLASLNQRSSVADEIVLTAGTACTNEWKSEVTYFTVDEDTDLTKGDQLVMYFAKGSANKVHVYVDDVKVTALAGVTVKYEIGDNTTSVYYPDGKIPTELPEGVEGTNADGGVLVLYTDKECKNEFVAADYVRTGEYKTVTLYGKYKDFKYEKDTELCNEKYDNAVNATDRYWGFAEESNDLFPTVVEENHVLKYFQNEHGVGIVPLGYDFKVNELGTTYIAPKRNVTYQVEFKYKVSEIADTAAKSELKMGIAVGNKNISTANEADWESFKDYLSDTHTTAREVFDTIPAADITVSSDWISRTYQFTVPTDCDVTDKVLQLFVLKGRGATILIDDVKVTALAGVTVDYVVDKETISVYYPDGNIPNVVPEGFESTDAAGNTLVFYKDKEYKNEFAAKDYVRTGEYKTVTLYGKYEKFSYKKDTVLADETYDDAVIPAEQLIHLNSGDLQPAKDPTDAKDTVLQYKQYAVGLGVLQLGYDYTDIAGKENLTDYVKAHAGLTYKITFDYLVKGTPANNACEVGVAIGAPNYVYGWPNDVSQDNYLTDHVTWNQELMRYGVGENVNTGWKTETIYVTVPENCDLSKFDAIQLYAKGGSPNVSVYFDNVKVIGLKDRSYTVKFNTKGGNAIADMKTNLAGLNNLPQATRANAVFMGWYLDAALKTPFSVDKCIEITKPITLYAKWHIFSNGAVITMDDTTYWQEATGELNAGRLNFAFVPTKDGSNNVMKYTLGYAASKEAQVEERGNVKLISDSYAQRMILYNPDLTVTGDYNYMDVTYRAQVGKTYKVSFDYKVTDLDTSKSDKGIAFSVLTGNVRNSHSEWITQSNRFTVETSKTGWKTATAYFTVNELGKAIVEEGKSYYSDAIMLGVSGYGSALIDNVSVTDWDIEAPTYVQFSTKGGEAIPSQEYIINAGVSLPKAVRKGYEFDAWYLDVKGTQKFNPATYKRTNGILVLYAGYKGMQGVTEIDFENYSYYKNAEGALDASRISESITPHEENGNTAAKYQLKYSTNKVEGFYKTQGNFGAYGASIGLHDPAVYDDQNATYEDAALRVKEGEKYWISFQYKANSVDTESTYPGAITFGFGVTEENSVHTGRQFIKQDISPVDEKTEGWVTASTYFTVPKLSGTATRLTMFIFGYGEVLIDNIKIIQLTDAVIFDTDGGTVIEPVRGNVGQQVTLPKNPSRDDNKFINWSTDAIGTQEYTGGKMEKGVKVVYAKFLTYQTIQDFEHYNIGKSNRFETDYYLNKKTNDTDETEYQSWLGTKYNADHVRNGKTSVFRKGENQYSRLMTLFYMNNPLTVGEEYELSVWMKITEFYIPGDIQIVHSDLLENVREEEYWNESQRGYRYETIANTELMSEYQGEWLEIKYTFTAKSKYIGLALPGITGMYIDDACITLTSADDSYVRSIEGDGIKYEDWYSETGKKEVVEDDLDFIKLDLDGNMNHSVWKIIVSVAAGVVVLGAGGTSVAVLVRKKKRGEATK